MHNFILQISWNGTFKIFSKNYIYMYVYIHTHVRTTHLLLSKFSEATIECGIGHTNTKHIELL
jgi:HD superfamily phosphohydrolase